MEKGKRGNQPLYDSPKELQKAVDDYFLKPTNTRRIYSKDGEKYQEIPIYGICGLAYALGFASRQSIYDYTNLDDDLSCIIKKARLFIESEYEAALRDNNVTGVIFALKQMGWKDKQEIEHSGDVPIVKIYLPEQKKD